MPPAVPDPERTEAKAEEICVHVPLLPREPTTKESGRWRAIKDLMAVVIFPDINSTTIDI